MNLKMTDAQKTLYYIAENMKMEKKISDEGYEHFQQAIKALELVEEFEKAQIITGGRLNGRTYAYKCGLEDGKRKALEQQPSEDCVSRQAVVEYIKACGAELGHDCENELVVEDILNIPPVTPTLPSSEDCVSRQATLDAIIKELCIKDENYLLQSEKAIYNVVKNVPSVTPTHGTCKECKYSNGRYIRRKGQIDQNMYCRCEKYHCEFRKLNFYCADFEKRGNENEVD